MNILQEMYINDGANGASKDIQRQIFYVSLCCVLILVASFSSPAHSAIVKWKDDKGVTHYGDNVPAQYVNRESSEISKQGVTLKRYKPVSVQDQAIDAAKLAQNKKDKALLDAFTNANEIDLARDRNLQLDIIAIENLQLQKKNSFKKLTENQSIANKFIKKNKAIPVDLSADIKNNKAALARTEIQINQRKTAMEETRQRFDRDKMRFIALKNNTAEAGTKPEAALVTKP
ncbi:MAG: DUF4124 domain-containing protein [Methylotenera sp.]|nr:DUF4124 domain-containing protein [Methylotenera sp.]